jgi:hypothetical protein
MASLSREKHCAHTTRRNAPSTDPEPGGSLCAAGREDYSGRLVVKQRMVET